MLNYEHLAALASVLREGSFQRAARQLHITQSAVSQRIRALEMERGGPLLVREDPLRLTTRGQELLRHFQQVEQLERELAGEPLDSARRTVVRLGVNMDSLATWFFEAATPVCEARGVTVELLIDNEDHTLSLLRRGEVSGCISAERRSIPGATSDALGSMKYLCVCAPAFKKKYFPKGLSRETVRRAPAAIFDSKDTTHERFLRIHLSATMSDCPHHVVPSSEGFLLCALNGAAFAMIPEMQCSALIKEGRLLDLAKGVSVEQKLFLHWILRQTPELKLVQHGLLERARALLKT